jgi:hypothetical protein
MHKGSCLCGAVSFAVEGDLAPGDACHCDQCRRWSGHVWASTNVPRDRLSVRGMDNVLWYQSSEKIRRGSCRTCGSALFWDPSHRDWTSIAMGAFDRPTGSHLEMHIWVSQKGDYYEIADGLPMHER